MTQLVRDLRRWTLTPVGSSDAAQTPAAIVEALEIMEARFAEQLTTAMLASAVGRERSYFCEVFRRATGVTPRKALTLIRLFRARELLRAGVKVEAVSLLVGFRSRAAFNRAFRLATGVTPARYSRRG